MLDIAVLEFQSDTGDGLWELMTEVKAGELAPIAQLKRYRSLEQSGGRLIDEQHHNVVVGHFGHIGREVLEFAKALRQARPNLDLIFAVKANADISALVRPSIRPAGIWFLPLDRNRALQTLKEIALERTQSQEAEESELFRLKCGREYYTLRTEDISFFESMGKKLAVKTKGQEIIFYSSFDTILTQLPPWFVRCHKGYVVNTRKIVKASFSEMTVELMDRCRLPISRTFQGELKEAMQLRGGWE